MFDVDTKDENVLKYVQEQVCGEHYLETFETKNGYHVLANKKFNANVGMDENVAKYVEVKSNALVLVAMGG